MEEEGFTVKQATTEFDVIVVGAGHAGVEAALVCARMGLRTLVFNLNLDTVAWMPCNPSIGGPAKGIVVREIDALGGAMAQVADRHLLNIRMLNTGKGPAVWALRSQIDKAGYSRDFANELLGQPNLLLRYGLVEKLLVEHGAVRGVQTYFGEKEFARAVIVTTGTFLRGKIFIGPEEMRAGRMGEISSEGFSTSLEQLGFRLERFKTGTPARIQKSSIDFDQMEVQHTSETPLAFSFRSIPRVVSEEEAVYVTRTNARTHEVIRDNLSLSPLYGERKLIHSIGPRYCPSIEDKVLKFSGRDSHQLFIEPEGKNHPEYYVGGLSTSLPFAAQEKMIHSIQGLEHAQIVRPAYAIEYDYVVPDQLFPTMQSKKVEGLFFAGQINGSSGYEEAAAQGLVAGMNAVLQLQGKNQWVPSRSESYIGVLIDDLVTRGTDEPYRLLTSRAEYRLLLRHDNAHLRLTPRAFELGFVSQAFFQRVDSLKTEMTDQLNRLSTLAVSPSEELNALLLSRGTTTISRNVRFLDLLKRPQLGYEDLERFDPSPIGDNEVRVGVQIEVQYEGYIQREIGQIQQMAKMDAMRIPGDMDFSGVANLATEARQKLDRIRPLSVGQASRIPGITPADMANLIFALRNQNHN